MRMLVTGGTGHLGQAVVSALRARGHQVRVLTRRPRHDPGVEWIVGDLATGDGVRSAVADVDAVIHAATNSPAAQRGRFVLRDFLASPADVDVSGTRTLLTAAQQAGVKQFTHVSIVGLEHLRGVPYSRRKLEAEQIVKAQDVPWSIVRATPFYWLLERMFETMRRKRLLAMPAQVRMEPVDSDEFAEFIAEWVAEGRSGVRQDFVGPQTLSMVELMDQYLNAQGQNRRIHHAPIPRRIQAAMTAGNTSPSARRGKTTWAEWLLRGQPAMTTNVNSAA
jgi:uncharacterized protein YbjT (DUF2867 family)